MLCRASLLQYVEFPCYLGTLCNPRSWTSANFPNGIFNILYVNHFPVLGPDGSAPTTMYGAVARGQRQTHWCDEFGELLETACVTGEQL